MLRKIFFSHYYLKEKNCTAFFLYEFDVVYEKCLRSRDLFEIFMMPPNYTQILKTKCTIPSVMKKIIPKLATKTTTKNHPFTYLWRDKKNLHTNEEKKESEIDF